MSPVLASPRRAPGRRAAAPKSGYTLDVVLLTVQEGQLAVALVRAEARPGPDDGARASGRSRSDARRVGGAGCRYGRVSLTLVARCG